MKVIITGATGFVGSQVLTYALCHPDITHIVLLQRRPLPNPPSIPSTKTLETVILEDFTTYPSHILAPLAGAGAILWALGGKHNNFPDLATAQLVNVDFLRAAIDATSKALVPSLPEGRKLRFVLCSGHGALWDPNARPWVFAETRRLKGAAEQLVFSMAREQPDAVEAYTCRPAVILSERPGLMEWVHGLVAPSLRVSELAASMVELGVKGSEERVWEYQMCAELGRKIVRERGGLKEVKERE